MKYTRYQLNLLAGSRKWRPGHLLFNTHIPEDRHILRTSYTIPIPITFSFFSSCKPTTDHDNTHFHHYESNSSISVSNTIYINNRLIIPGDHSKLINRRRRRSIRSFSRLEAQAHHRE